MQIHTDVLETLSAAVTSGNMLKLPHQLDRKLYEATDKVLKAAGGKWNRKAGAHVFTDDAEAIIEPILLTGEIVVPQDFGYFPTPPALAAQLVALADIRSDDWVLEPSAGTGNLAKLIVPHCKQLYCYELLPSHVAVLRKIRGIGRVFEADFLQVEPEACFERIVMNPPFTRGADMRHVLHALKFLAPGGKLAAIMSPSWNFRQSNLAEEFRHMMATHQTGVRNLPAGSFRDSGTAVNTQMILIET